MTDSIEYPPLHQVTKPVLTTKECAHFLNRPTGTLLNWSSSGTGPIQPRRVGSRLCWPTARVRELVGG